MNRIIDFVLRNRLLITVLTVIVMAAGYMSYRQLPIDAFPDVSPSLVQVFTQTEGLAPEEIEKYVTYPVETAMNGLPNLQLIRSVSNFGLSVVNIYFEDGTDIYFARQLVNERLTEARQQIPAGFGEPGMGPISTGMGLILFYYLEDKTGKYSLEELRTIQDWLVKYQLQTVPGVTEILGIGGWEKQFQVVVNPNSLLRYDVTVNDVVDKIKANNLNVGAQFLEKNAEEFIVRSTGLTSNIEDLENIVIKSKDGIPVYLSEVANVKTGGAIRRGVETRNGVGEVVAGMVVKLFGTNSSTVIRAVEDKLAEINKALPEGIKIVPYYQQKTLVEAAVKTVTDALLEGIVLVVIILMVFLGAIRPSVVVAIAIPFSVLFAMIGMKFFGISANLMSFGGLAIAIGMMVDGAVVIVENTDRLLRASDPSESKTHIIARACKEVIRPITFAVIIIIIVFLPLFTLRGVEGKTFKPLAYTIALAMFGSLLFGVFVAPVLSSFFMKKHSKKSPQSGMPSTAKSANEENKNEEEQIWILRLLIKIYKPLVTFFVNTRIAAIAMAVILIIIGILIFPQLGSEFTPTLQEGTLILRMTMAPSISLTESTRLTLIAERRLMKIPEVTGVVTRIGRGEIGAHTDPVNSAEMTIILKPRDQWRNNATQQELEILIRDDFGEIPGILTNFTQPIQMSVDELLEGVRAELAIKFFGTDLEVLKNKADEIAAQIRNIKGAADVQVDQVSGAPQLSIVINRHEIARYGINVKDVQQVIRTAIGGEAAGQIFEDVKRFDIYVRFNEEFRKDMNSIGALLIKSPSGIEVPLSQLAEIKEVVGSRQITRERNQRFITIQCNVTGRDIGSFVAEGQNAIDKKVKLPPGYFVTWGGQFKLQQEANARLAVVVPITLFIIFIMLFSSFNSLKNSLLIFLNVPLALVGGIVALWISGQNLSVPASVGFIALFGIALLNGIVLVTYLNQLRMEGLSVDEASIQGACLRVRPVLMTALAAALGMIPLLFATGIGSEVQKPLATVVIGGLVTSTALTLLVIPALYKWFAIKVTEGEM
ncbi:MAG: CusA/CzcA family heavy metal efflux RND transporter [Melioribacteraceae bacterium]